MEVKRHGVGLMKRFWGSALALWMSGTWSPCEARLGDDENILNQKHGEGKSLPSEGGLKVKAYRNEGLSILVYFRNGLSVREVYGGAASDPEDPEKVITVPITPELFDAILRANSAGKLWLPLDRDGKVTEAEEPAKLKGELGTYSLLLREDGKAVAQIYYDASEEKVMTLVVSDESLTRAQR